MSRFLKYINYLIAVLLIGLLIGVYWFVYRALPQTSGQVQATVSANVSVTRDARGIPYIKAANEDDLFFAQGYVTAQDRLFQLELTRRRASGDLAELVGARGLESDLESRRMRMRRIAEVHTARLNPQDRPALAAYARGVNYFIETHLDTLPVEFRALGVRPAPWTIRDSVLVALEMFRNMTQGWQQELARYDMVLTGADPAKVATLFPARTGLEPAMGSNAWVVSGQHTVSGKPLLASDPHLRLTMPNIWHEISLEAPGIKVAGVALPGLPGVGIGHNQRIAWGITNLGFDVQDLYVYPAAAPFPGQEREVVRIRGGGQVNLTIPLTQRGPVFQVEERRAYALRWIAAELPRFSYPIVGLNKASNWQQFRDVLRLLPGPGFNFVYADVDGNIGYQVAGQLPVRGWGDGTVPKPAQQAPPDDWKTVIPFDDLPSVYNPPSGRLVTANQNPFPADYKYPVNGGFAAHFRAAQIEARLRSREKWDVASFGKLQTDVYSAFDHHLAQELARAAAGRNDHPEMAEAVRLLKAWNGQMEANRPEPLIVELAFVHFRKAIAQAVAPGKAERYSGHMTIGVVDRVLDQRGAGLVKNYDQVLVDSLKAALQEAEKRYRGGLSKWRYGLYNFVPMRHPGAADVPLVGGFFKVDAEMPGAIATVNQNINGVGPSMRMVADVSDWDRSTLVLPLGQSGLLLSSHFKDQWTAYSGGNSYPLLFTQVPNGDTLTLTPVQR